MNRQRIYGLKNVKDPSEGKASKIQCRGPHSSEPWANETEPQMSVSDNSFSLFELLPTSSLTCVNERTRHYANPFHLRCACHALMTSLAWSSQGLPPSRIGGDAANNVL